MIFSGCLLQKQTLSRFGRFTDCQNDDDDDDEDDYDEAEMKHNSAYFINGKLGSYFTQIVIEASGRKGIVN